MWLRSYRCGCTCKTTFAAFVMNKGDATHYCKMKMKIKILRNIRNAHLMTNQFADVAAMSHLIFVWCYFRNNTLKQFNKNSTHSTQVTLSDTKTYICCSRWHRSPPLCDKFVGVQTNFNDVVEQSKEGSQRERCYKDGGESKLKNCKEKKTQPVFRQTI